MLAFAGVLWSISTLLFGVAVAYAALGSVLTIVLGRPLIWLNYNQLDQEANLRADLIHLRQNAELVALSHHEARLGAWLLQRLDSLTANWRRVTAVNRNLAFFTTGYNYMIQIIPALVIAPLFLRGDVEFGDSSAAGTARRHSAPHQSEISIRENIRQERRRRAPAGTTQVLTRSCCK